MKYRVFCMLGLCYSVTAEGAPFFKDHAKGWHWYATLPKSEKPAEALPQTPEEALALRDMKRKELEGKLALAVFNPTKENLLDYMRYQYQTAEKASLFSSLWQQVLYQHPEIDQTVGAPTLQAARPLYHTLVKEKQQKVLHALSKRVGLLFYFQGDCTYCQLFAPIIAAFATQYGFSLLPVSLDGKGLPPFTSYQKDNGSASALHITKVPTVLAFDTENEKTTRITTTPISLSELEERLILLLAKGEENAK